MRHDRSRFAPLWLRHVLVAIVLSTLSTATASAQYFGRNKVQYKKLDFEVLKTEHFDIYFYPSAREGIDIAARMAERWHARLGEAARARAARPPAARALRLASGLRADQHHSGRARRGHRRRHRAAAPPHRPAARRTARRHRSRHRSRARPRVPVRHHRPDRRRAGRNRRAAPAAVVHRGHGRVPLDRPGRLAHRDVAARRRAPRTKLPASNRRPRQPRSISPIDGARPSGRTSAARGATRVIGRCCRSAARPATPPSRSQRVLGLEHEGALGGVARVDPRTYRAGHRADDAAERSWARGHPSSGNGLGGDLNVGPTISPDGRLIAFLSERSLFSIDLFVADAATGKIAAQADEHGDRSALLEPAVHLLSRARGTPRAGASRSRR